MKFFERFVLTGFTNLASSIQNVLEEVILLICRDLKKKFKKNN